MSRALMEKSAVQLTPSIHAATALEIAIEAKRQKDLRAIWKSASFCITHQDIRISFELAKRFKPLLWALTGIGEQFDTLASKETFLAEKKENELKAELQFFEKELRIQMHNEQQRREQMHDAGELERATQQLSEYKLSPTIADFAPRSRNLYTPHKSRVSANKDLDKQYSESLFRSAEQTSSPVLPFTYYPLGSPERFQVSRWSSSSSAGFQTYDSYKNKVNKAKPLSPVIVAQFTQKCDAARQQQQQRDKSNVNLGKEVKQLEQAKVGKEDASKRYSMPRSPRNYLFESQRRKGAQETRKIIVDLKTSMSRQKSLSPLMPKP